MSDPDPYPRLPYPEGDFRELCEAGHWISFIAGKVACTGTPNEEQCKADKYAEYKAARDGCPVE